MGSQRVIHDWDFHNNNNIHRYWCQSRSRVQFFLTPWTIALQAPLSMEFSRQEYWSRLPILLQGYLPDQGSNLGLLRWRQIPYRLIHQGNLYPNTASSANCKTISELCFNSWLFNSTEKITFITLKLHFIFGPTLKTAFVPQFSS